jgi:3-dehydroquinate dehydratase-2
MKICIINGPNLNLTGSREQGFYGLKGFDQYIPELRNAFPEVEISYFQSNVEGELINKIQAAGAACDGIILNAGGYTHTSVAIGDAVKAINAPVVEVHISNVGTREEFRQRSYISSGARGVITGFGLDVYRLALLSFLLR